MRVLDGVCVFALLAVLFLLTNVTTGSSFWWRLTRHHRSKVPLPIKPLSKRPHSTLHASESINNDSERVVLVSVVSLALGVALTNDSELDVNKEEAREKIEVELLEEPLTEQVNEHFNKQIDKVNEDNQNKIPLHVQCCKVVTFLRQIMPELIRKIPIFRCGASILSTHLEQDPEKKQQESCKMLECFFDKFGLLTEYGTVKEKELKKYINDRVVTNEKDFVSAALDKCFIEHNNNPSQGRSNDCTSGSGVLFGCINAVILTKCPKNTMWKDKPECK